MNKFSSEKEFRELFKTKSEEVFNKLGSLKDDEIEKYENIIVEISSLLPKIVLIGSWALRLHLKEKKLPIISVSYSKEYLDIDYIINPKDHSRIRETLKIPKDKNYRSPYEEFPREKKEKLQTLFFRKRRDISNADRLIYLDAQGIHIELFSSKDMDNCSTNHFILNEVTIQAFSPEEIFYRRLLKIKKLLNNNDERTIHLPIKNLQYLYVNGLILNFEKMRQLWNERKYDHGLDISWRQETIRLLEKIKTDSHLGTLLLTNKVA